jgi:hypothetical protein
MTLCLIAIFKNESNIMNEWIQHYLSEGVDKFLLIDNGSTDNYREILQPYITNNVVDLVVDSTRHKQTELYNKYYLNKCKEYDWVIICDLDEFIYSRLGYKTINHFLATVHPQVSQVCIPWKMFGSNGYNTLDKLQPNSVINAFNKRINYDKQTGFQGVIIENNKKYGLIKCIVRTNMLLNIGMHSHTTNNSISATTNRRLDNLSVNKTFALIDETILRASGLHLNHYAIQSLDWFIKVKSTRGDASTYENVRNLKYFNDYDINDIIDDELIQKRTTLFSL